MKNVAESAKRRKVSNGTGVNCPAVAKSVLKTPDSQSIEMQRIEKEKERHQMIKKRRQKLYRKIREHHGKGLSLVVKPE